jgi:hypothetical protein
MPNPVYYDRFLFNLKQNPMISNAQAMLGGVFCEPLDVTLQIIAHFLDSRKDSASNLCHARLCRDRTPA